MADGISAIFHGIEELRAEFAHIERATNRATMWAVRQTGRQLKQTAKATAPVYRGKRRDIPKGRLKRSIHSDRRLGGGGGTYSVKVGPRGWPAVGYAGKEEARSPYMARAHAVVSPQMTRIASEAWTRATRGRR